MSTGLIPIEDDLVGNCDVPNEPISTDAARGAGCNGGEIGDGSNGLGSEGGGAGVLAGGMTENGASPKLDCDAL